MLQCMRHDIFTTARLKFEEAMKKVMKYIIIMHNVTVEKRLFKTVAEKEQFAGGMVIGSSRETMWKSIVLTSGVTNVSHAVGTLA